MAYIKAYSDENARHPDLFRLSAGDDAKVTEFANALMDWFKLPRIPVEFGKRNGGGHFRHKGWDPIHLAFTPGKATLLLVAHEVAHYLTLTTRKAEFDKLQKEVEAADAKMVKARGGPGPYGIEIPRNTAVYDAALEAKKKFIAKRDEVRDRGAHTQDFARNVDRICAQVRLFGWHKDAPVISQGLATLAMAATENDDGTLTVAAKSAPPPTYASGHTAEQVIEMFKAKLPERLYCPKCDCYKAKEDVGVRVMSRSITGLPVVIKRQSYCRPCRSAKK